MPSTDLDGSVIVILSEAEARRVYEYLADACRVSECQGSPYPLDTLEQKLANKIARDLKLPVLKNGTIVPKSGT